MATINKTIKLQDFIKLPVREVTLSNKISSNIVIETPHKGKVIIELTKINHPFLFGPITETNKSFKEILEEAF